MCFPLQPPYSELPHPGRRGICTIFWLMGLLFLGAIWEGSKSGHSGCTHRKSRAQCKHPLCHNVSNSNPPVYHESLRPQKRKPVLVLTKITRSYISGHPRRARTSPADFGTENFSGSKIKNYSNHVGVQNTEPPPPPSAPYLGTQAYQGVFPSGPKLGNPLL